MKEYHEPISGKLIGVLDGKIFRKNLASSRLFLKTPTAAITLEAWIVDDLKKEGCEHILVHNDQLDKEYHVDFPTFCNYCASLHYMNQDELKYLPMSYWADNETKQLTFLGDDNGQAVAF